MLCKKKNNSTSHIKSILEFFSSKENYMPIFIFFRLTFALLEDTGWYQPNYEYAHEISWGRGMGCEFAQKSCMEMMERNDRHFCQDLMSAGSSKTTCTFDSTGTIGICLSFLCIDFPIDGVVFTYFNFTKFSKN